jgi:hypothetical protein
MGTAQTNRQSRKQPDDYDVETIQKWLDDPNEHYVIIEFDYDCRDSLELVCEQMVKAGWIPAGAPFKEVMPLRAKWIQAMYRPAGSGPKDGRRRKNDSK